MLIVSPTPIFLHKQIILPFCWVVENNMNLYMDTVCRLFYPAEKFRITVMVILNSLLEWRPSNVNDMLSRA